VVEADSPDILLNKKGPGRVSIFVMARRYVSFDLTISKEQQLYSAVASTSEAKGVGPVRFSMPFTPAEISWLQAARSGRFRDLGAGGVVPSISARELGSRLFEAVFQGAVQKHWISCRAEAWTRGQILRLRLILLSPELWRWPWEYLWDRDFLVLRPDLSVVRCSPAPPSRLPSRRPWRLRVLVVACQPGGGQELCVDQELEALTQMLKSPPIFPWVKLKVLKHATLKGVADALAKPFDILHFIGHGTYDRHKERGFLLFETEDGGVSRVSGRDLAPVLMASPSLALVVLNACESGRASEVDAFAGVAQSLGNHGLGAVLAMQFPVADDAALVFSKAFYRSLFRGTGLDRAVHDARRRMFVSEFKAEFGNPVLYLQKEWPGVSVLPKVAAILLLMAVLVFACWLLPPQPFVTSDPGCPSPPGLKMRFARIQPGVVVIEEDKKQHIPERRVYIEQPFCFGKFEVYQQEWKALGLKNPSKFKGRYLPVESVAAKELEKFFLKLNERDPRGHYRLPSEAERLLAVEEGGRPDAEEMSRFGNCSRGDGYTKTSPVGSFEPNTLGIYDLYGNVSEWVSDRYVALEGESSGDRMRLGGSFGNSPENCAAAYRTHSDPNRHDEAIGFRIVRDVVPPP
jgi:hypothetical protein